MPYDPEKPLGDYNAPEGAKMLLDSSNVCEYKVGEIYKDEHGVDRKILAIDKCPGKMVVGAPITKEGGRRHRRRKSRSKSRKSHRKSRKTKRKRRKSRKTKKRRRRRR